MHIMTQVEPTGAVTLVVRGTLNAACVPDVDRAVEQARRLEQPLFLDLSGVRLIDRPTLQYLIDLMEHEIRLVICPAYVEQWIAREMSERRPSCAT
jgi:anti-anti-sigma regulatory factor